ncbi:MAG: hypothetical protein WCH07_02815 [Deltaproteobacteria bacterium]
MRPAFVVEPFHYQQGSNKINPKVGKGGAVLTDKVLTDEEFITAFEETKPKTHSMIITKIDPNLDRFVTLEEIQSKLREHQFAVAYYVILEDALSNGDFVLCNSGPPPTDISHCEKRTARHHVHEAVNQFYSEAQAIGLSFSWSVDYYSKRFL